MPVLIWVRTVVAQVPADQARVDAGRNRVATVREHVPEDVVAWCAGKRS
jgi:hypothetical protein